MNKKKKKKKGNYKPLAIFCSCTAPFVSDLVGNPVDRFSHNEAHIGSCRYRQSLKSYWKDRKPIIDNVSLVKDFLRIYVFIFYLQRS